MNTLAKNTGIGTLTKLDEEEPEASPLKNAPKDVQDLYSSRNIDEDLYIGSDFSFDGGILSSRMKMWLQDDLREKNFEGWIIIYYVSQNSSAGSETVAVLRSKDGTHYSYMEDRTCHSYDLNIKEYTHLPLKVVWKAFFGSYVPN